MIDSCYGLAVQLSVQKSKLLLLFRLS